MSQERTPILEATGVSVVFRPREGLRRIDLVAVDDVSLKINPGETLGLVGESGSGKSTLGRALVGIERLSAGTVRWLGRNVAELSDRDAQQMRRNLQMVFQDPAGSLDPKQSVASAIEEPLRIHGLADEASRRPRVLELLDQVGLPETLANRLPHELSGGQQQRVAIARALSLEPDLIVCDEAVSSLDVSIQAQVVNLLRELQRELGLAYMFIAHDLAVVRHIADRVAVMYLGKIVERAPSPSLYARPLHPYTQALLSAAPVVQVGKERRNRIILRGDPPSPTAVPSGCPFHTRCIHAVEQCRAVKPEWEEHSPAHWVSCHFAGTVQGTEPARSTAEAHRIRDEAAAGYAPPSKGA